MKEVRIMDIHRVTDQFGVSAQMDVADVLAIAAAGYRALVCNRPDGEWTSPDLVESHLLFPVGRVMRGLERCRTDIANARMPPARIVEPLDVFSNCLAGLIASCKCSPPDQFGLDGLEYRFDHGVVMAVATPTH